MFLHKLLVLLRLRRLIEVLAVQLYEEEMRAPDPGRLADCYFEGLRGPLMHAQSHKRFTEVKVCYGEEIL